MLLLQVGIIRQVEVELDNTLRDLRDSHKEESAKLKKWRSLDKDVQAKLAEFPVQSMHDTSQPQILHAFLPLSMFLANIRHP